MSIGTWGAWRPVDLVLSECHCEARSGEEYQRNNEVLRFARNLSCPDRIGAPRPAKMGTALSFRVLLGKDEGPGEGEKTPHPRYFAAAAGST